MHGTILVVIVVVGLIVVLGVMAAHSHTGTALRQAVTASRQACRALLQTRQPRQARFFG